MPNGVGLNHRPPLRVVRDRDGRLRVQLGLQRAAAVRAPRTWRGRVNPDGVLAERPAVRPDEAVAAGRAAGAIQRFDDRVHRVVVARSAEEGQPSR